MKKPRKLKPFKLKALDVSPIGTELDDIIERVSHSFSEYHRCGASGPPPRKRTRPASHCPREWTKREALNALRQALRARAISQARTNEGFPRHVWYLEHDCWYEARTENNSGGVYHGYPVEDYEVPERLRQLAGDT